MVEMVKGLAARGHVIDAYCPTTADHTFFPIEPYVRRSVILPFEPAGVWPRRIPLLTPYVTAVRLSRDLTKLAAVNQQAAQQIDIGQYDVVFSHDCQLAQNPDVLRFLQTPTVHYCHHGGGSRLKVPESKDIADGLKKNLGRIVYALPNALYPYLRERKAETNIRAATITLTNSYFACERLYYMYNLESQVCYLGVDTAHFRPLYLPRQPFVLSVGAVHYFKGYRFLLEALRLIPVKQRPALIIAANSSETAERQLIEQLAGQYGIDLSIRQINDDEELLTLYNSAAAFVYTPIMEPWGLTALEAMACATPVVAVREGGIRESVVDGETGLLTDRQPAAFAEALQKVLLDPALAKQLGSNGRVRAEQFSWERTVDQLENIFAEVSG